MEMQDLQFVSIQGPSSLATVARRAEYLASEKERAPSTIESFVVLGRGVGLKPQTKAWEGTESVEEMDIVDGRGYHSGRIVVSVDANSDKARIGGAKLNIEAATLFYRARLAQKRPPRIVIFAAGTPKY